jgi:hypothetical protein
MCCNFENGNGNRPEMSAVPRSSSRQIEQPVDELILFTNIIAADPPRLPFPDHVHRFVSVLDGQTGNWPFYQVTRTGLARQFGLQRADHSRFETSSTL